MNVLISYLILIVIIGLVFYATLQLKKLLKLQSERKKVMGEKRVKSKGFDQFFNKYAQKGYNTLARVPVLNKILFQVRKKLETLSVYDEYSLRKEVMRIVFSLLAIILFAVMLLVVLRPSVLIIFWVLVGILLATGILIDFFIYRVEFKLLSQLKDFNNRVRFNYQQTKMVDEAYLEGLEFAGPEMKVHAERMNKILNSVDMNEELARYEEVAPSRFLRVVAGLAVLVKERGDKIHPQKGSSFLAGLEEINKELNADLLYRSRLTYALRSLSTLALIPVFFTLPVKNYNVTSFPTTVDFYESRLGFLAEIVIYSISIICYLMIRKMREISEQRDEQRAKRRKWETWVFKKMPIVEKICIAFSPRENTKKHYELKTLLKQANEIITVYEFTLRKLLLAIVAAIVIIGAFIYSHHREVTNTLNSSISSSMFTSDLSDSELKMYKEKTEYDKEIIAQLEEMEVFPSSEELAILVADHLKLEVTDEEVLQSLERISNKWNTITNSYLKWWEVLVAILLGYIISQIPLFILHYKRRTLLKQMEYEIYQLLVILSVLKDFDGMSTSILLEWMKRFSVTFRPSLLVAIENFDSGQHQALEQLMEANSFEPFQQIVKRLMLTLERLSIQEAFNDIDIERYYYLEQRKEEQKREVKSKERLGGFLGLGPLVALIFIYLVFPIMYVAVTGSKTMLELLQ